MTIKDCYALPDVNANLSRLAGSKVFSSIDNIGAFHAVNIRAKDRPLTAFNTSFGQYQFRQLCFGVCNGPATYARLAQKVLNISGLPSSHYLAFLDDTLIHSSDTPTHLKSLSKLFQAYSVAGLRINPKKCQFFHKRVKFLGHQISQEGVSVDPEYTESVRRWPLPCSRKQTRAFLGKIGYYRRFIKGFQTIAAPMNEILRQDGRGDKELFKPTPAFEMSFKNLKSRLLRAPILAHPDFASDEKFVLDTDFSQDAGTAGAVLSQRQNGREVVLAYGSVKLNSSQSRYDSFKGELLSVLIFLKKFRYFLQCREFILRIDNNALKYLHTMSNPSRMFSRWIESLANFQFQVVHRTSKSHANADQMSRIEHAKPDEANNNFDTEVTLGSLGFEAIQNTLRTTGKADSILSQVYDIVAENRAPTAEELAMAEPDTNLYLRMQKSLYLDHLGRLCIQDIFATQPLNPSQRARGLLVVPTDLQEPLMTESHEKGGHRGRDETVRQLRRNFYFPRMAEMAQKVIQKCTICNTAGGAPKDQKAFYWRQGSSYPYQRLNLDYVGPLVSSNGCRYILSVCDLFSKFYHAFPVRHADAKTTIRILLKEIIPLVGIPEAIHHDRGSHFTASTVQEIADQLGIEVTTTPAYNPKSSPVERFHSTLKDLLSKLVGDHPQKWSQFLPHALFTIRTSYNRNLGASPFEILYGRRPTTSLDILFREPTRDRDGVPQTNKEIIQAAQTWVRNHLSKAIARQRRSYISKLHQYLPGDQVWLFTPVPVPKGTRKFAKFWTGPWRVTRAVNKVVYEIAPHPTWMRKKNQVVSIDRLKRFQSAEGENIDEATVPPPHDSNLDMYGDEFAERFDVTSYDDNNDDGPDAIGLHEANQAPPPPDHNAPETPAVQPNTLPPIPEEPEPIVPYPQATSRPSTPTTTRKRRLTPTELAIQEAGVFTRDMKERRSSGSASSTSTRDMTPLTEIAEPVNLGGGGGGESPQGSDIMGADSNFLETSSSGTDDYEDAS